MVIGDPVLVVGAGGRASGLGAGEGGVGGGDLDLLGGGLLGAGGALGGGQESLDPGLVDEVEGACEGAGEEEVEEDAGRSHAMSVFCAKPRVGE